MARKPARRASKRKPTRKGKKTTRRRGAKAELIISKSRTKSAAGINVSGEFYGALDDAVRKMIASAEDRAVNNGRKTLRPHDL